MITKKLTTALAAILLGTTLAFSASLKEGDTFPDLAKYGLEGKLPELQGKVVLVDFLPSRCGAGRACGTGKWVAR